MKKKTFKKKLNIKNCSQPIKKYIKNWIKLSKNSDKNERIIKN